MHSMQEVCLEGTGNALNHCPWIHSVLLSFGFSREMQIFNRKAAEFSWIISVFKSAVFKCSKMLTFILIWFQQNTCRYPHIQINTLLEGLEKLCFVVFYFPPEMDINCLL